MSRHIETGKAGEEVARKYLLDNGYGIRETNWRDKHREIDILAEKDGWLVVVEVKSRSGLGITNPSESVDQAKQTNLILAAEKYVMDLDMEWEVRFDIIIVTFGSGETSVEHIRDAFFPMIDQ